MCRIPKIETKTITMKKFAILLLSIVTITVNAQNNKNCVSPISNYTFSQKFAAINAKKSEVQKLNSAKLLAKNNCLSTAQVKKVAELFENDFNRLTFVKVAYHSTTDKNNFYDVYNTFMYFSTVFRLHDYIASVKEKKDVEIDEPEDKEMTFPNIQYPDFRRYFGKIGCKNIINDQQFMMLAQKVFEEKNEYRKLSVAKNSLYNRCFLTAHAMKMASLLTKETDRLAFLKSAYSKVYDPDNYKYAPQLFKNARYKQEIRNLIGGNVEIIDEKPPCEIGANEFTAIKKQIDKESFNNTKINLAKQIIRSKKCFTSEQVTQIIKLFRYSSSQMEIAKFAYDYTTDKDNYFKVASVFSFTSDRDKLLKYVKEKSK